MNGCESLTFIDLSNLTKLAVIGNYFLINCKKSISIKCSKKIQDKLNRISYKHDSIEYITTTDNL